MRPGEWWIGISKVKEKISQHTQCKPWTNRKSLSTNKAKKIEHTHGTPDVGQSNCPSHSIGNSSTGEKERLRPTYPVTVRVSVSHRHRPLTRSQFQPPCIYTWPWRTNKCPRLAQLKIGEKNTHTGTRHFVETELYDEITTRLRTIVLPTYRQP